MKQTISILFTSAFVLLLVCLLALSVSAQSGGTYEITSAVVTNGGGQSGGANFEVNGSNGQSFAGAVSSGGQFGVRGGFWQAFFAPTAALVPVSGRVLTAEGNPIARTRITLTDAFGAARQTQTSSFGYFRFDDVEVGQTYILSVSHKRFQFSNQTQVVFVSDEVTDIVFVALPE